MLQKMGWTPGKGLGLNENGQVTNLPLEVKQDVRGVGCKPICPEESWKVVTNDYQQILCLLSKGKDLDSSGSDDEDKHCKDETESCRRKKTRKGKEQNLPPNQKQFCRYIQGKVMRNKNVSNYSKEDLAAILGVPPLVGSDEITLPEKIIEDFTVKSSIDMSLYFKQKNKGDDIPQVPPELMGRECSKDHVINKSRKGQPDDQKISRKARSDNGMQQEKKNKKRKRDERVEKRKKLQK
eukprot:TRINITY_DN4913_c0_g2_i1.p1 TRINITY_DN4913_c0_g2~~TRINITY_DN4913_c0_g2_i1.p1  ORF type:complete len:238 (+),score=47.27 TRINITY_DN4913_c0_g2_i1:169-882(+)